MAFNAQEIDAAAASASQEPHHIAASFRSVGERETDADQARQWQFLAELMGMHFKPSEGREPFGPQVQMNDRRSIIPADLTDDQCTTIRELLPALNNPQVVARLGDVLWIRRREVNAARRAIAAYVTAARGGLEDPNRWATPIAMLQRAGRLSRQLGRGDQSFAQVAASLDEIVDRHQGRDPLYFTGKALDLMLEFQCGDGATAVRYARVAADVALGARDFHRARFHLDVLSRWMARNGDAEAATDVNREIARTYEFEAEAREQGGDHLGAVHFWQQAIEAHRRMRGGGEVANALRPRLQAAEIASRDSMRPIETAIELEEAILKSREHVSGKPKVEAVLRLCGVARLVDVQRLRENVLEMARRFPLQALLGGNIVDHQGRTVGRRPGVGIEELNEEGVFARMIETMKLRRDITVTGQILPAFNQINYEHTVTRDDMVALVSNSPFVPPDRRRIFAQGLWAGFDEDFLVAAHLLVPQIENSLRYLMQAKGMITTSLDAQGVQREIDLNGVLADQRLQEILSDSVIVELRSLFTDNRGPNLRNLLAHGLVADDGFFSAEAVYAWWLVLGLSVGMHLIKLDAEPRPQPSSDAPTPPAAPNAPLGETPS